MRLRDLEDAAAAFDVDALDLVAADERDERVDFTASVGDADIEDLEEALDAFESRALEAAALRGGMMM